jgi:hypothetical protein
MSKSGKNTPISEVFPYDQFPFKVIHKDGNENKTCYFQCQNHVDKYVERCKFNSKDYQLFIKSGTNVETVGKGTRRKSTPKKASSRSSRSN